jgi:hypothetical protein
MHASRLTQPAFEEVSNRAKRQTTEALLYLCRTYSVCRLMQLNTIKAGDNLTFQWRPVPLRRLPRPLLDGQTVIVLAVEEENIKVLYRLNQEAILLLKQGR